MNKKKKNFQLFEYCWNVLDADPSPITGVRLQIELINFFFAPTAPEEGGGWVKKNVLSTKI